MDVVITYERKRYRIGMRKSEGSHIHFAWNWERLERAVRSHWGRYGYPCREGAVFPAPDWITAQALWRKNKRWVLGSQLGEKV